MAGFQERSPKERRPQKGSPNKATESIKSTLNAFLSEDDLVAFWMRFLRHKNPHIAFEAFKLALHYRFGKPMTIVAGPEHPPIKIDISAIRSSANHFLATGCLKAGSG